MPKGPDGQKRPGDVIGAAVMVAKIATGEIEDNAPSQAKISEARAQAGSKGGKTRAERLAPKERTEIATRAAKARWSSDSNGETSSRSKTEAARTPRKAPS